MRQAVLGVLGGGLLCAAGAYAHGSLPDGVQQGLDQSGLVESNGFVYAKAALENAPNLQPNQAVKERLWIMALDKASKFLCGAPPAGQPALSVALRGAVEVMGVDGPRRRELILRVPLQRPDCHWSASISERPPSEPPSDSKPSGGSAASEALSPSPRPAADIHGRTTEY